LARFQPGPAAEAILAWALVETGQPSLALDCLNVQLATLDNDTITHADMRGLRAAALASLGEHVEAEEIFVELKRDWPEVFDRNPELLRYLKQHR